MEVTSTVKNYDDVASTEIHHYSVATERLKQKRGEVNVFCCWLKRLYLCYVGGGGGLVDAHNATWCGPVFRWEKHEISAVFNIVVTPKISPWIKSTAHTIKRERDLEYMLAWRSGSCLKYGYNYIAAQAPPSVILNVSMDIVVTRYMG